MFYEMLRIYHVSPVEVAGWSKGQMLVVFAQGKMKMSPRPGGARVFTDLNKAWEYHQARKRGDL